MTVDPALVQLFQSFALAGVVTLLVNLIAPFLERYAPFANPQASTHDATLRALNLALNVGLALGIAALMGQANTGPEALAAIGLGVAQATGSHLLYASGNRAPSASPSLAPLTLSTATLAPIAPIAPLPSAAVAVADPTAAQIAAAGMVAAPPASA